MSNLSFQTDTAFIQKRIDSIDPSEYAKTRNFLNGAVTKLSPYLSRGVISLSQIRDKIIKSFPLNQSTKLLQELAWREYYQRIWQVKGDAIFTDLKQAQTDIIHYQVPTALLKAATSIDAIDHSIYTLYHSGYMHNHCRMYIAMLACNIAKTHWLAPSQWMYYHLLDGDLASNTLSWQWVAGSFSNKKYVANQDNINTYTGSDQRNTFLDVDYPRLENIPVPEVLKDSSLFLMSTVLPESEDPIITHYAPLFIYNSYQIDPDWHSNEAGNRVLLLEPEHFKRFPVSDKVLNFIISLAKAQIPDIRIFCGSYDELVNREGITKVYFKEHPLNHHYKGQEEDRTWMFPEIKGYYPSFFSYWKKCERYLR